jgi:DNA polymerase-1
MLSNYAEGKDIYTTVGETMGVDRKAGKVLVLAMAYGVGPDKIAKQIDCSLQEAKALLNRFSKEFPAIDHYRYRVIGATRNNLYVTTLAGRKRFLPDIISRDIKLRSSAERQAFNTKIQGSAADIMKMAMVRAHAMLPEGASLLLTVHDELVTIAADNIVEEAKEAIRSAMEDISLLKVPLIADVKVVKRWGEAK